MVDIPDLVRKHGKHKKYEHQGEITRTTAREIPSGLREEAEKKPSKGFLEMFFREKAK